MTTLDQISINQVNQNGLENRSERKRAVDRSLDQKANVTEGLLKKLLARDPEIGQP